MQIFNHKFSQKKTEGERQKKIIMPPLPILDLWKERQERERDRRERQEKERERERDMHATPIHYPEPAVSRGIVLLRENTCVRASQNISQKLNLKQHFMTSDVLKVIDRF